MEDEELLIFINRSRYRVNILKAIGHGHKIPSVIAKEAGILLNHISYQLSTLSNAGLVVCINPEYKKGRLYRLTEKGLNILDDVEYEPKIKHRIKKEREAQLKKEEALKKKSEKSANSDSKAKKFDKSSSTNKKTSKSSAKKTKKNSKSPKS